MAAGTTQRRRRTRGFTLIERMTVVALLAIIASVAAPGLRSFLVGQRLKTLSFDLTSDLLLARSEALKRGLEVVVEPDAATWDAGWRVSAGATLLSSRAQVGKGIEFSNAPAAIVFDRNGRVAAPAAAVRITILSPELAADVGKRCIELDLSGRARAAMGACS
jgi:type IV fimbrial biogenesis protein FimT